MKSFAHSTTRLPKRKSFSLQQQQAEPVHLFGQAETMLTKTQISLKAIAFGGKFIGKPVGLVKPVKFTGSAKNCKKFNDKICHQLHR